MDDILKNLKESSKNIKLETNERISARETLLMFMNENPLKQEKVLPSYQPILISNTKSPYVPEIWFAKYQSLIQNLAIVVFVFVLGTGVYAEKALPGGLLYGIKISVNENLRSTVSLTDKQKVNYNIDAIERRLTEGEKLAIDGSLTVSKSENLKNLIDKNLTNIGTFALNYEKSGDSGFALNIFSQTLTLLKGHHALLSNLSLESVDSTQNDVSVMLFAIQDQKQKIEEARLAVESKILSDENTNIEISTLEALKSTEKLLALAETETKAVISFNETVQAPMAKIALMSAGPSSDVSTPSKLQDARNLYDSANKLFQSKKYAEARILLEESSRLIAEVELSKTLSEKYNRNIIIPDESSTDRLGQIIASSTKTSTTTSTVSKTIEKTKATTTSPSVPAITSVTSSSTPATSTPRSDISTTTIH